jgi:hypothetical protein
VPRSKSLHFFCAGTDLLQVIRDVETTGPLRYVLCGLFEEETPTIFESGSDLPDLGVSVTGISIDEPTYLVVRAGTTVTVRPAPLNRGGVRYAVDQRMHPHSITLTPGGVYVGPLAAPAKEECVIAGNVGTVWNEKESLELYTLFGKSIRKRSKYVRSEWLGPEAMRLWMNGARLTDDVRASRKYDLRQDPEKST